MAASEFASWIEALGPEELLACLDEQHPIYREETSQTVAQKRGWIFVLLSRSGLPPEALPFVLEDLDTSHHPYLVAAAALALRSYKDRGPDLAPFLRRAEERIRRHDEPISFACYGDFASSADASSAVKELRLTLDALGPATDEDDCCTLPAGLGRFSWLPGARTSPEAVEGTVFEDQSGARVTYRELFCGQPSIVAFFYTRCDNPLKCSLTVWKLARTQKLLEERGLSEQIRTAGITYDPAFDVPARLQLFGRNRGLRMDENHRLLRSVDGFAPLRAWFKLGVSFFGSLVNRHRIEIFLLDRRGRIAGSFQRFHWDEAEAVDQAAALLAEPAPCPPRARAPKALAFLGGPAGAVLAAVIPKCPVCWSAYLSAFGLTAFAGGPTQRGLRLLAVALLALNLASVFWRARATRQWLGPVLSSAGTAAMLLKLWLDLPVAPLGIGLVLLGSLVSALGVRPRQWFSRASHGAGAA